MTAISYPIYGTPLKEASDGRFWKCPIDSCGKGFRQLNGVIAHYHSFHDPTMVDVPLESQEERPFKCPFDECRVRPYQNSNGLAYHLTKVHGEGIEIPLNAASHKRSLLHPEISRPFTCPNDCGKSYRNTNGLSYHLKKSRCSKIRMQDTSLQEFLKRNMPNVLIESGNEASQPQKKLKTTYLDEADLESISSMKSVPAS